MIELVSIGKDISIIIGIIKNKNNNKRQLYL